MKAQMLFEVWKVVEYREGLVYKIKSLGYVWLDLNLSEERKKEIAAKVGGDVIGSISTAKMKKYGDWNRYAYETDPDHEFSV